MSRGFKETKSIGRKHEMSRQNSYDYLIKSERVPSRIEQDARKRFKTPAYFVERKDSHGNKDRESKADE